MSEFFRKVTINLSSIHHDNYYKISREHLSPELVLSIKNSGMLETPFLLKKKNALVPFTCHNRIKAAAEAGLKELEVYIVDSPESGIFKNNASLKIFRGEVGPIGRLKAMAVMNNDFGLSGDALKDFARKILKLPAEIINDNKLIENIFEFPAQLQNYIDQRDLSFKIIKDITGLGIDTVEELSRWVQSIQIRLNIFKLLTELLFDIIRRDGFFKPLDDEIIAGMDDKELYEYIFRLRYPDFSLKKESAGQLIKNLERTGAAVEFPEFFEKGQVSFRFTINKKDSGKKLSELAAGLESETIDKLLALLP